MLVVKVHKLLLAELEVTFQVNWKSFQEVSTDNSTYKSKLTVEPALIT